MEWQLFTLMHNQTLAQMYINKPFKAEVLQYHHIPSVPPEPTCWSRKEFRLQGIDRLRTVNSLATYADS